MIGPDLNLQLGLDTILGWLIILAMIIIVLLLLVTLRQAYLMDKVVNVPVGGNFKMLAWGLVAAGILLTAIVLLVS